MAKYVHRWFGLGYLIDDRGTKQKCWRSTPRDPQVMQAYMVKWNTLTSGGVLKYHKQIVPILSLVFAMLLVIHACTFILIEDKLVASLELSSLATIQNMAIVMVFMCFSLIWWRYRPYTRDPERVPECTVCPACAHVLDDILPEPDGCTVCPTCKAAWRLSE